MNIRPKIVCYIGFITCLVLEVIALPMFYFGNGGTCEKAGDLNQTVNVTSVVFVVFLDSIFASLVLKCGVSDEVDPWTVVVNAWSSLVCTGAGVSTIVLDIYYCGNTGGVIVVSGSLMIFCGVLHLLNAIYAYTKS